MASEDLKQLVARQVAHGETVAEVARRHEYSWKGMHLLVQSEPVQALIREEREALEAVAEQARARLVGMVPTALDNLQRIVEDPTHSQCVQVSRWVADKVLPSRPETVNEVQVNVIASEALEAAAKAMREPKEQRENLGLPGFEKYLLRGSEGLVPEGSESSSQR